jgi:hypothetical protein
MLWRLCGIGGRGGVESGECYERCREKGSGVFMMLYRLN